jgi:hypothetical protein
MVGGLAVLGLRFRHHRIDGWRAQGAPQELVHFRLNCVSPRIWHADRERA